MEWHNRTVELPIIGFINFSTACISFMTVNQMIFETNKYDIKDMMFRIHLKGMQLDAEYEMAGKNIDEMTS